MILDQLENAARYAALNPHFERAFAFLRETDWPRLPDGRHDIDGDRVFVMLARGQGRDRAGAKLEAHRRYLDIQLTLEGHEQIGYKPTALCKDAEAPFDEQKDVILFRDLPEIWTPLDPGMFAIYFPEDAHAPLAGQGPIRKAVVKILL